MKIIDFVKETKGASITTTSAAGVVGNTVSVTGAFTAILQPIGTLDANFDVSITGVGLSYRHSISLSEYIVKIGGIDVSSDGAASICAQLRDEVLF